jgi:hypothetical protein
MNGYAMHDRLRDSLKITMAAIKTGRQEWLSASVRVDAPTIIELHEHVLDFAVRFNGCAA